MRSCNAVGDTKSPVKEKSAKIANNRGAVQDSTHLTYVWPIKYVRTVWRIPSMRQVNVTTAEKTNKFLVEKQQGTIFADGYFRSKIGGPKFSATTSKVMTAIPFFSTSTIMLSYRR